MIFFHSLVVYNLLVSTTRAAVTTALDVSAQVGGEVVIRCVGQRPSGSRLVFCRGTCSEGNILVQADQGDVVTRRGRYSLKGGDVLIKKLRRVDEGSYVCEGHNETLKVTLKVTNASTVPAGSSFSTSRQIQDEPFPEASSHSSTRAADNTSMTAPRDQRRKQKEGSGLPDATVVLVVSVTLALMVCAIIPLIFYTNWRSNARDPPAASKSNAEESSSVRLQSLDLSRSQDPPQDSAELTLMTQSTDGTLFPK